MLFIGKSDATANVVTISRAGADTIMGQTTVTLETQYDTVYLVADGVSTWWRIG
jgi:hypothetical protein